MRKTNKNDYDDVNNSMEKQDKKDNKSKKNKKKKSNYDNILDEIKKEEESDYKKKILEEVNNSMYIDNNKNTKNKNEKEKELNQMKKKDQNQKNEERKEKVKEEKKDKPKKKEKENLNKQKNNILSDTFNEIENELNEQYSLEIENIFEINKKFNYPKNSPVFYIREDNSNNDLYQTPLSTNEIKDLLKKKILKPFLIKVKLIDIFIMKNYESFSYFDFNEILSKNWSKNLEYSPIFLNEYNNYYEKNKNNIIEERNKKLEVINNINNFTLNKNKEKKLKFNDKKEKQEKIIDIKNNNKNDMTLSLNFSAIDKKGYNDFSISIIKQLEGIALTKKKLEKITSIIEEVEEDEWTEIKSKKKEIEKKPFVGIVGLNESRQIDPKEFIPNKNKKKTSEKNKKKQYVNFENKFAAFKIDHGSDDEEDEK